MNHVWDALNSNTTVTTSIVQSQVKTSAGGFSVATSTSENGWWKGVSPPFAFIAIDAAGNIVLDGNGRGTIVAIV